jgi:hypothetical protein
LTGLEQIFYFKDKASYSTTQQKLVMQALRNFEDFYHYEDIQEVFLGMVTDLEKSSLSYFSMVMEDYDYNKEWQTKRHLQ